MTNVDNNNGADQLADDDLGESKSEAMNRWSKEGVAKQAADYRMERRKVHRAAGMNRGDAHEQAWAEAIKRFPTPEDARYAKLLAAIEASDVIRIRGETLPADVGAIDVDGLSFKDVWITFHIALASRLYLERSLALPDENGFEFTEWELRREFANLLRSSLRSDLPGSLPTPIATTRAVMSLAIDDLPEFLSIADRMFHAAIEHAEKSDDTNDEDLDLLEKATDGLVTLQVPIVAPADAKTAAGSTLAT